MARTYPVVLERSVKPAFPNRCVSCGAPDPSISSAVTFVLPGQDQPSGSVVHPDGPLAEDGDTDQLLTLTDVPDAVFVPCCDRCQEHIRKSRFAASTGKTVLGITAIVLGVIAAIILGLKTWQLAIILPVIAFLLMLPFMFWKKMKPPAIDLENQQTTISYIFLSREYAEEFARMNPPASG